MDRCDRPVLPCLFAIAALALAPACMAQDASAPAPATDRADAAAGTGDAPASTGVPRSAFGKVMSLLISALEQNADAGTGATTPGEAGLELQPAVPAPPAARDIQVSAAFRLGPATRPVPDQPATASID